MYSAEFQKIKQRKKKERKKREFSLCFFKGFQLEGADNKLVVWSFSNAKLTLPGLDSCADSCMLLTSSEEWKDVTDCARTFARTSLLMFWVEPMVVMPSLNEFMSGDGT